jgi:hypothetical protein
MKFDEFELPGDQRWAGGGMGRPTSVWVLVQPWFFALFSQCDSNFRMNAGEFQS